MDVYVRDKWHNWTSLYGAMSKMHVDSIIKRFGTKQILTDVFLSCEQGEIVGLLGRNGSGKSTLLQVIFGSLSADTKFVRVGSQKIEGLYDNRNLINYLPQDGFLPSHIRVKQAIRLFCDSTNAKLVSKDQHVQPLLSKKRSQLSGGELRLLEVLLIIHSKAKYILIDEPFSGVAPLYREKIKKQIRDHSSDKGFIITDHDYRNILDLSTKTILMYDGGTKTIENKDDLKLWGYIPEIS